MRNIERFFSLLLYVAYIMLYYFDKVIDFINPATYLAKTSFFRKRFEESGINPNDPFNQLDTIYNNKKYGLNITLSKTIVSLALFFMAHILVFCVGAILGLYQKEALIYIPIILLVAFYFIPNKLVFNNNKHLKYFRCYEQWSLRKNLFFVLLGIVFSLSLIVFSFMITTYYGRNCLG